MIALPLSRQETNPEGYSELDDDVLMNLNLLGDRILVDWEEAPDMIECGKLELVRPDRFKKGHYTGTVIAIGPAVTDELTIGDRIVFNRFSNFDKFWNKQLGRLALIRESEQQEVLAIIPKRGVKVTSDEGDFQWDM